MDVSPVLVADLQAPEAVEPGERPFDHPAVASQAVLGLDTTAGDARDDAALAQGQTEVTVVVTLVGMELVRSATGPAARLGADGLDGVDGGASSSNRARSRRSPGPRAGCRGRRPQDGASCPVCRDPLGSCPFLAPRGRHRGGVQRGPVPVDAIGLGQLFEKHLVQPAPDARLVPASQPAPARHPAPTPHLGRQVLQGDARLQHEQDPRQRRPVRHPGPSALGLRRLRREQRRDPRPERIRQQFLRQAPSSMAPILLPWLLTRRFC